MIRWRGCIWGAVFLFIPFIAMAGEGWDYWAGAGARSLPLGAGFVGGAGYGVQIWGDQSNGSYNYGYIRPVIRGYSSGLVSQLDAELNLFPVSIAGLTLGYERSWRNTDFNTIDCTTVACRGQLGSFHASFNSALGFGKVFLLLSGNLSFISPSLTDRPFADENSMLVGNPGGDSTLYGQMIMGYQVNDKTSVGFKCGYDSMRDRGGTANHESVFVLRKMDRWSFILGAGTYESVLQPRGFTAYGVIRWVGIPSIAFF